MNRIMRFTDWLWGYPIIILLLITSIFLTIYLNFVQFRHFIYILKQTFGRFNKEAKGEGTITPKQALTSALSSTVGAANIVGVPTAIMMGGPGALFWMLVIAFLGMALKFSENVLGIAYREKNKKGEFVGGPTYYMYKGFKNKKLGKTFAYVFAFIFMVEIIASVMVQGNSVTANIKDSFHINPLISGIVIAMLTALVVIGGVKSIANVTEKLVPIMVGLYLILGFIIIVINFQAIPGTIGLIFKEAFYPTSVAGGGIGAALASTMRWGFARGVYSNEAGLGSSPIAHAAAKTDHPVRQAFWGIAEIIVDTVLICTTTGLVVLLSGVWKEGGAKAHSSALTARAYHEVFGSWGSTLITLSMFFFVFSTLIVVIFYGSRMAEFLFGIPGGWALKGIYTIAIILGAIGVGKQLWDLLDLALACLLIPNVIAVLILSPKVKQLYQDFFRNYYEK
ncbi:alanine/glycine:cation symporter family protein [Staphylococcus pettenkoferi]|uniref:alanine/glycine:cation symporter family protein n=1 Tax=Staphylococcus pettenkoferi TaxID=170573 RepID=UPI00119C9841|nr:sodium:alanine symporter family protein [Staphylococcus pettenkoferi]MCY1567316.1 sodium:alanine symporter family protein [Staphylococcus pettenkoferi]MCY1573226.1 sodium:alanine symporter family protein [Staphylococcus pettenkoferi]MCY1579389.1 sodium:alanine symporter family protein [Staphylococcus pettenkoferi]MCY1588340.1 sodium:alanine symporter family protein [Staphylococcus pettenkoferi]MDK7114760.1 sodium:alanine symporter family protein [Staphylococcus pettenkoferi]